MIVESSAIVAVVREEPEARVFAKAIESSAAVRVSAATTVECGIELGPMREFLLDRFVAAANA